MFIDEARVGLRVELRLRLHIDVHGLRQVNGHVEFHLFLGQGEIEHPDAIQITILSIASLKKDFALKITQPFNCHRIGKHRAAVGIKIGFGTVQSENRWMSDRQIEYRDGRCSNADAFSIST